MPQRFAVSLFHSARDNRPKALAVTWAGLVAMLAAAWRYRTKAELPAWSPASYRRGARRGVRGVDAVSCLVFDYDDGTGIEAAREPWMDFPHMVHTSWSHRDGAPRFRLVLPLAQPVPATRWTACWLHAAERAAGQVDPKCKDPCRLYFLPGVSSPNVPFVFLEHDPGGHLLALDPERAPTPASTPVPRRAQPRRHLPAGRDLDRQRALRLRNDPNTRRRAGQHLGGRLQGTGGSERVTHVPCPGCARPSVHWFIQPERMTGAACNHKNSCGWRGPLVELLVGAG